MFASFRTTSIEARPYQERGLHATPYLYSAYHSLVKAMNPVITLLKPEVGTEIRRPVGSLSIA